LSGPNSFGSAEAATSRPEFWVPMPILGPRPMLMAQVFPAAKKVAVAAEDANTRVCSLIHSQRQWHTTRRARVTLRHSVAMLRCQRSAWCLMAQQRCQLVSRHGSHFDSSRPRLSRTTTGTVPWSAPLRVAPCCTWLVWMALRWMCVSATRVVQWMVRLARVAFRQLILSSAPRAHPSAPCTRAVAFMHRPSFHLGFRGPRMRCRHMPASALTPTCYADFMLLSPPRRAPLPPCAPKRASVGLYGCVISVEVVAVAGL